MLFGGETADSYYEEGVTAAMKGDLDQAIRHLTRALELNTEMHNARHQLGKCYMRQGKPDQARRCLEVAAQKLPGLSQPRVDLGFVLLTLGKIEAARAQFSEALNIKTDDARAVLGLGCCAFECKQWETATRLAQRALELGRVHFDAHFLLARAADNAGMLELSTPHFRRAIELMDQSIETNPDQTAGYYLRGSVYFETQQYPAAKEDFETALKLADKERHYSAYHQHFTYVDILTMLGRCLLELGQPQAAAEIGKEIAARAPTNKTGQQLARPDDAGKA